MSTNKEFTQSLNPDEFSENLENSYPQEDLLANTHGGKVYFRKQWKDFVWVADESEEEITATSFSEIFEILNKREKEEKKAAPKYLNVPVMVISPNAVAGDRYRASTMDRLMPISREAVFKGKHGRTKAVMLRFLDKNVQVSPHSALYAVIDKKEREVIENLTALAKEIREDWKKILEKEEAFRKIAGSNQIWNKEERNG